ncbi:MAG TPA: helix-turn-helix transcriptional regulator [Thermoanaerobaculia bacterium]|jgi:transcriptional regulator with XRE-family HTH domain|nr:helix-turn-helix transcriptional regulator [Thermoanaerobaculia bacterium]
MEDGKDKLDFGLVLVLLRAILGWNRATLAQKSGVDEDLLASYERGLSRPFRKTKERLAKAFEVEVSFLDELMPFCRRIRLAYESARKGGRAGITPVAEIAQRLEGKVTGAVVGTLEPFLLELAHLDIRPEPRAEDRSWARELWLDLESLPAESQAEIIRELHGAERSWALAVQLSEASEVAAADSAAEALRLARLAAALAQAAPGPETWLALLAGFCDFFVANALRVGGKLAAAREAFARADQLWAQGEGGDPLGLLDATRRLDLKASFLKSDGRPAEALLLLDQALQTAQTDQARGRLLLKKATCHEFAGEHEAAIETLCRDEPWLAGEAGSRLPFLHRFTLVVNYCHLDRYKEAEALLPRVEELAAALNTQLDGIRTLWLKGKTRAGLGRREEALAALEDVRRHFRKEEIAYDYALVSLELATLHLEQGRTRQAKEIAEEMFWIFKGEKVHKEALAALALFREAARQEKASAGWTRRMVKYLYQAQHNPKLRFEA